MPDTETMLAALEDEKAGYLRRGLKDRAAEVDKAIAALKKSGRSAEPALEETATVEPPEKATAAKRPTTKRG